MFWIDKNNLLILDFPEKSGDLATISVPDIHRELCVGSLGRYFINYVPKTLASYANRAGMYKDLATW